MPMPQLGRCKGCDRYLYVNKDGYCIRCLEAALSRAAQATPDQLRDHPDLEDLEYELDYWYEP